jgi:putative two-component system response regulator
MKKILIIDDDPLTRASLAQTLLRGDYRVLYAKDGQRGLEQAKKSKPDLIICDLDAPGLSGLKLRDAIREDIRTKYIPIIFLSESPVPDGLPPATPLGRPDYLTKPVDREKLVRLVQLHLSGRPRSSP